MKYLISIILIFITNSLIGQNTFPASGNVGIGNLSPASTLDVISSSNSLNYSFNLRNSDLSYKFRVRDDGNWAIGNDASVDGNYSGSVYGGALGLIGTNSSGLYFKSVSGSTDLKNWYLGSSPTSFMIRTLNDTNSTLLTPLTITRDGKIGLGGSPNTASVLQIRGETSDGSGNVILTQNSSGSVIYRIENRGFHIFTPSSYNIGNGSLSPLLLSQTVTNTTGSNTYSALKLAPTYNLSAGTPTVIGINYEPTETLMTGATHIPIKLGNYLSLKTNSSYTASLALGIPSTNTSISMTRSGSSIPWTLWTGGTDLNVAPGPEGANYAFSFSTSGSVVRVGSGWDFLISNSRNIVTSNRKTAINITELQDNSAAIIGVGGPAEANIRMSIRGLGTTTGTALRVANSANTPVFTLKDNGETNISGTLSLQQTNNDETLTQVLVRDSGTGEIKYRSASSLQGVVSPWVVTGSDAHYDSGNIGIGISNPQNKLDVNGTIHSKEVKVDLNNWPDYVFEKNYQLTSLGELKTFIEKNQHLPELPTAKEVETEGVKLGEMNALLLKKIEEMTLHLIRQQEEIDALKAALGKD